MYSWTKFQYFYLYFSLTSLNDIHLTKKTQINSLYVKYFNFSVYKVLISFNSLPPLSPKETASWNSPLKLLKLCIIQLVLPIGYSCSEWKDLQIVFSFLLILASPPPHPLRLSILVSPRQSLYTRFALRPIIEWSSVILVSKSLFLYITLLF